IATPSPSQALSSTDPLSPQSIFQTPFGASSCIDWRSDAVRPSSPSKYLFHSPFLSSQGEARAEGEMSAMARAAGAMSRAAVGITRERRGIMSDLHRRKVGCVELEPLRPPRVGVSWGAPATVPNTLRPVPALRYNRGPDTDIAGFFGGTPDPFPSSSG